MTSSSSSAASSSAAAAGPATEPAPVAAEWPDGLGFGASLVQTAGFAVAMGIIAALCPSGHRLQLGLAVVAAALYIMSTLIPLRMATGLLATGQPAFVVLLFAVPINLVPLCVAVVMFPRLGRKRDPGIRHLARWLADCWWCIPPVLILATWAPGPFDWSQWPIYAAALAGQFAVDLVCAAAYTPYPSHTPRRERLRDLVDGISFDLLLSPVGLAAAAIGRHAPGGAIILLLGVGGMLVLLAHERSSSLEHRTRSLRDPLTGAANRALLDELVRAATLRHERTGRPAALLLLDLNDFKAINDEHGHLCGDRVLRCFADRIQESVRATDTVARLGGDEFAVLVTEMTGGNALAGIAADLRSAMARPLHVPEFGPLAVGACLGAVLLDGETSPEQLIAAADQAMYAEKRTRPSRRTLRTAEPAQP